MPPKIGSEKTKYRESVRINMSRKGQSITLSLKEHDKAQLEALAIEFGHTWGDRPNVSKLVEAIARRHLLIAPNHNWTKERIAALNQARSALVDAGQIEAAVAIAQLLLRSQRTHPSPPQRARTIYRPTRFTLARPG